MASDSVTRAGAQGSFASRADALALADRVARGSSPAVRPTAVSGREDANR
jgi:hypothetical protein